MDGMTNTCKDFIEPVQEPDNGNKCVLRHCGNIEQVSYWKTIFNKMFEGRRPEIQWEEILKEKNERIKELEIELSAVRMVKNYWIKILTTRLAEERWRNNER